MNMSKVQRVRASVKQRLSLAAEEICELFERTIAEYEEELCRRQKLLDIVFKPEVRLHRADVQLLLRSKEKVPPEQQDWSSSLDQENPPKPLHIKEEQEELSTYQEGEEVQDIIRFEFGPVKSEEEDGEQLQIPWLQQTEADGEDCEEPDPERHLTTNTDETASHCEPLTDDTDYWMRSSEPQSGLNLLKSDNIPENDLKKPPHIKEEQEGLLTNQEGEQLQDLIRFGFSPVSVKREEEDEERLQISQLQQRQAEELRIEADGEDCEKPDPERHLTTDNDETASHCEPLSDDDTDFCMRSGEPQPGSNLRKNRRFGRKKHQKKHVGNQTGEKTFSCTVCDKKYRLKKSLTDHMRFHKEKRLSCPICEKKFHRNAEVLRHMRVHTRKKPYICSVCGLGFTGRAKLAAHAKLAVHMTGHTGENPLSCTVCNASFKRKEYLSKHMRLHSGDGPFSCSVCSMKFQYKTTLINHMVIHKEEKPFHCITCDERFSQVLDLIKHKCIGKSSSGELNSRDPC